MPIQVICPGCHTRFKVSEKFAGKKGPCPKCKKEITIPRLDEQVTVHAPDEFAGGGRDTEGKLTLKPIERTETKLTLPLVACFVVPLIGILITAWLVGRSYGEESPPAWLLGVGAVLVAPPLVYAGYTFLRDQELAPLRGKGLLGRVLGCGVLYAALWAAYAIIRVSLLPGQTPETFHLLFMATPLVFLGASVPLLLLELDYGAGLMHFGLYIAVTMLLALLAGAPAY